MTALMPFSCMLHSLERCSLSLATPQFNVLRPTPWQQEDVVVLARDWLLRFCDHDVVRVTAPRRHPPATWSHLTGSTHLASCALITVPTSEHYQAVCVSTFIFGIAQTRLTCSIVSTSHGIVFFTLVIVTACHDSNTVAEPDNRHPINDDSGCPSQAEHLTSLPRVFALDSVTAAYTK
jgi:hypothetical protein